MQAGGSPGASGAAHALANRCSTAVTIGSCSRLRKVPYEVRIWSSTLAPPAPTTVLRFICSSDQGTLE